MKLLGGNFGRCDVNQVLFADNTALVADPEEWLCRPVSEFYRISETKTLQVNIGDSKVMRCSMYVKYESNVSEIKCRTAWGSGLF